MIKGMLFGYVLIFMVLLQDNNASYLVKDDGDSNKHMCSRLERYTEEILQQYNETFLEPITVWCVNIPPVCTRYREAVREINKTIVVPKTKIVFECCKKYVMKNGKCSAICSNGCVHGKCDNPNSCDCEEGWKGPYCDIECDDGWYGEGCRMYCTCQNGATCDKKNGFCHCPPGFAGTYCESVCPQESYGKNCDNECHCKNGGVCNFLDGSCNCPPGYVGKLCENQCQDGTYGDKCQRNCSCHDLATIFCSHIDGKCMCVPGWKGDACSSKCDLNTWGAQCSKKCECPNNAVCDHVTGNCSCQPGWYGDTCEKKCPDGYFGKDCKMKCPDCLYLPGTCHYITGQCSCPPGSRGSNCDLECPENTYGESCSFECSCSNNSLCDSENGVCTCLPGWFGDDCTMPCPIGMYGLNCSFICGCIDNSSCNPISGKCAYEDQGSTDGNFHVHNQINKEASIDNSESAWDIFFILLVSCIFLGLLLFAFFALCITKRAKKSSYLRKEESSTTNVIQEDGSPSIASFHFMNPNYEATDTIEKEKLPFSLSNSSTLKKEEEKLDLSLEAEKFEIPDCDKASSLEEQCIEISLGLTNKGGNKVAYIPEIRCSKSALPLSTSDEDASSQASSIYGDVEYKNENHCEISSNPTEKRVIK